MLVSSLTDFRLSALDRRRFMISTLVDLLVSFEAMARRLHSAIPGDQMSLQFLGLV